MTTDSFTVIWAKTVCDTKACYCGYAYFPWMSLHGLLVMNSDCPFSTIAHEMGHALGLLHTQETAYGAELVDESNCNTAGDQVTVYTF
jgi:hypothetical protein